MIPKICCVTGHRNIPIEKVDFVTSELKREILLAIENGFTHFISGFAEGVDLIFADIISELKKQYNITLEAAVPYEGRIKTPDKTFKRLIKNCDIVKVHSNFYEKSCYMKRNKYMVLQSDLVIAIFDGRQSGGTFLTIKYAQALNRKISLIKYY